jgi:hypothetical protein
VPTLCRRSVATRCTLTIEEWQEFRLVLERYRCICQAINDLAGPVSSKLDFGRRRTLLDEGCDIDRDDTVSASTSAGDNIRGATDFGPRGG